MWQRTTSREQDARRDNRIPAAGKRPLAPHVYLDTPAEIDRTHLLENKQKRTRYLDTHFQGLSNRKSESQANNFSSQLANEASGRFVISEVHAASGDPSRIAVLSERFALGDSARVARNDPARVAPSESKRPSSASYSSSAPRVSHMRSRVSRRHVAHFATP